MIVPEALIAYLGFSFFSFAYLYIYIKSSNDPLWFYEEGFFMWMSESELRIYQGAGVISHAIGVIFLIYYAFAVSLIGAAIFYLGSHGFLSIAGGRITAFFGIKNILNWGGVGLLGFGIIMFAKVYEIA